MNHLRKTIVISFIVLLNSLSFALFGKSEENILKVGATPIPHGEILNFIKENFNNEKFDIEVVEYTSYDEINEALLKDEIDANYFQHQEYLEIYNIKNKNKLVSVGEIHFEKMGIYSNNKNSIKELEGTIAIPNDESNRVRALKLLEDTGLIELNENNNIIKNPRRIDVVELDVRYLYRIIDEVDVIVINANVILEEGYEPFEDALYLEEYNEKYANLLVKKIKSKKIEEIDRLKEIFQDIRVKTFIKKNYKGSIEVIK